MAGDLVFRRLRRRFAAGLLELGVSRQLEPRWGVLVGIGIGVRLRNDVRIGVRLDHIELVGLHAPRKLLGIGLRIELRDGVGILVGSF